VAAGIAHLQLLDKIKPWNALDQAGAFLCEGLLKGAAAAGVPVQVNRAGSMFTVFFTENPVTDTDSAIASHAEQFALFFHALLSSGVYFPPSQYESCFLSIAHTERILSEVIEKAAHAFQKVRT
jgi:glutamate-1-semialdehyde 2,1-aminomutase